MEVFGCASALICSIFSLNWWCLNEQGGASWCWRPQHVHICTSWQKGSAPVWDFISVSGTWFGITDVICIVRYSPGSPVGDSCAPHASEWLSSSLKNLWHRRQGSISCTTGWITQCSLPNCKSQRLTENLCTVTNVSIWRSLWYLKLASTPVKLVVTVSASSSVRSTHVPSPIVTRTSLSVPGSRSSGTPNEFSTNRRTAFLAWLESVFCARNSAAVSRIPSRNNSSWL